jgi:hypothetical protein
MKQQPLSWEWVRWEMAMLVLICLFLVATSHDTLKTALLIPVIPVAFKLLIIWNGPRTNDVTKESQPPSPGDVATRAAPEK